MAEDANIEFEIRENTATGTLDSGNAGIMDLADRNDGEPPVVNRLAYWTVPRNDGFVIMPNNVEAYHRGPHPFEHNNTTGFVIRTLDFNSNDAA